MTDRVGTGYVPIKPDTDGFGRELERGLDREGTPAAGRGGDRMAKAMKGAFFGAAAAIGKSVWDFAGFERGLNEVFTLLPGISGAAMDEMSEQTKQFAADFRVLPAEVVPALYQALSAGVPRDNVFQFLETSTKLSKGGVTDLTTAVDGLSSVVNAYGADVLPAAKASDLMFTTVKLGKTTIEELSQSLFQVTPTAAGLGVSFDNVTAALAAMTLQGVPTSVATTQLRQLFVELSKAGGATADMFTDVAGKSFREFIASGGNLQDALQLMQGKATDLGVSVSDLFGSVEAGSAALALTGPGAESFAGALDAMATSAGATDAAFAQMQTGLAATWDGIRAKLAVSMLNIGEAMAPTIGAIGEGANLALELFGMLPGPMQAVAVLLATITAGLFAFAKPISNGIALFKQLGGVWRGLAANPWVLVLAGLVAVTVLIVKNWEGVKRTLGAVWDWLRSAGAELGRSITEVWHGITSTITTAAGGVVNAITGAWSAVTGATSAAWSAVWGTVSAVGGQIVRFIVAIPSTITSAFATLADVISAPFRVAFGAIKGLWNSTVGGFGFDVPSWVPFVGGNSFRIPSMAAGGVLTGPQLVLAGEYPGAATNPEIVTPQHIMRETVREALTTTPAGGSVTVNLTMNVASEVTDPAFFDRVALQAARAIGRELERSGAGRGKILTGAAR